VKSWQWFLMLGAIAILLLPFAAWIVGRSLSAEHTAESSIDIDADVELVAARVRDVEQQPRWRKKVQKIAVEGREGGAVFYREFSAGEQVAYAFYEREADRVFESVVNDKTLPYGGRWLISLEGGKGRPTKVRVREEGIVYSPMYRALGRYVFGFDSTLKAYLQDLAQSFLRDPK